MDFNEITSAPKFRLIATALLVVVLAALIPFFLHLAKSSEFHPERHGLVEYFVAFLAVCLFLLYLRRFYLQFKQEYLFLGLGFLVFVVFQLWQNFTFPGFHNISWLPASKNIALGFDSSARLFFALYLLVGASTVNKFNNRPSVSLIRYTYLSSIAVVVLVTVSVLLFLPPVFFANEQTTMVKKSLDFLGAAVFFVAFLLLIRRYLKLKVTFYFWIAIASLFGTFTNIYLALWNSFDEVIYDVGHVLEFFVFTSFLIAFFSEHIRLLKFENELRESLERSREKLEKSEKIYRELIEKMADGIFVTDKKSSVIFSNEAFADMVNYSKEELIGLHLSNFFDRANYEKITLRIDQRDHEHSGQFEVELRTNDNQDLPVLMNIVPITDARGQHVGIQAVVTNLTERKKIELELENLVKEKTNDIEIFQQCIENSTDGILITDLEGKINYVNRAFETMIGCTREEIIGLTTSVLEYNRRSEAMHKAIWTTVENGHIWHGELETKRKNGSRFIGEVSVVPIREDSNQIASYLWVEKDITRRKTLETSLKDYAEELMNKTSELESAKTYYQSLISGMSDILLVVDNEGNCTFINDFGIKRLKFQAEELTKRNLPIFFDDLKRLEKDYGSAIKVEVKDFEGTIKTADGESILCSWYAKPLFDSHNRRIGAMAVGRDITEYKRLQNELKDYTKNLENKVEERTSKLRQKVKQLGNLLEIGEEIRLNVDIDVILNKICEAVQTLGWHKVIISLRDYEKRTSRPVAAAGLEPAQVEEVMNWGDIPFEHTEKYLREKFRISNSYFVSHQANLIERRAPYTVYSDLGPRQSDEWDSMDALLVPIRTKDKILGIISVDDPEDRKKPVVENIRDLEIFADKAALAINNARLFQAQKENEKRARLLAEMSKIFHSSLNMTEVLEAIVNKGAKAIGEFCSLILLDEGSEYLKPQSTFHENPILVELFLKGNDYFPCRIGDGLVGKVVANGTPLLASRPFPDEMNDFKETQFHFIVRDFIISSLIILPLRVRGRIIGAMIHLSLNPNREYRTEEFQLAQELGERAALAIENARLFQEVGDKANELEQANKLKSEFLANVSHELRTPLNAIITLSDILSRGMTGDLNQEQIKQLEIIQRSGKNLLNLINDILDLSKIEAGKIEPMYSVVPIGAVIEETIEHIRPLCDEKGLTLDYKLALDVPKEIYSDQDKITKAVINLLSNAVKFTRRGGITVKVGLKSLAELSIEVSDTGIGIPQNRIDEIFNEFHQIDSSDSRRYGGTGLGLAITKKVVQILGGSVSVKSQIGKGSTFTLLIPIKQKADMAGAKVIDLDEQFSQKLLPKVEIEVVDDRDRLNQEKKLVLVIDDEKEVIYIMRQYLHQHNYQILFPQNGEDVLQLARTYKPFAITLDILMPNKNGWDILGDLKKDGELQNIPVIIASILAEKERALELGAAEYFVKPFEPLRLVDFLRNLESKPKKKKVLLDLPRFLQFKRKENKRSNSKGKKKASDGKPREKILLVDDDKDTQYAMQFILEEAGYDVFVADDGREAVKQAESLKPSLILMDIMMPGMDGYEATKIIKDKQKIKHIPIVAMTAKAMKGDREKTFVAGCDDYIAKPFETQSILDIVKKWIKEDKMN
ncbi:MAG: PAS domain S-box protein [bacterium]